MSSISSAHDPRAAHCQYSSACARQGILRVHWSPRKSPRDIFSVFFLGAARKYVSHVALQNCRCGAGQKRAAWRAMPALLRAQRRLPTHDCGFWGATRSVNPRAVWVVVESGLLLSVAVVGGCGVKSVRGQGPPVFGKCAKCLFVGWPLSHHSTSFYYPATQARGRRKHPRDQRQYSLISL